MATLFHNGQFFIPQPIGQTSPTFAECLLVDDSTGVISYVGKLNSEIITSANAGGAALVDLKGRIVLPGFIDGHMHAVMTGESLSQLDLRSFETLETIRGAIREYAQANPHLTRLICRDWFRSATGNSGLASDLDDLDPRPLYIHADDRHAIWCNSAALAEVGVENMPDPPGGQIHRDENGKASGMLAEMAAVTIAWPSLNSKLTQDQRLGFLKAMFDAYSKAGYTGVVEMAMTEADWELIQLFRAQEKKTHLWMAAHWLIVPQGNEADNLKQVDRAIELHAQFNATTSPECRIAGIKLICDGVVDACTASLQQPYSHDNSNADPAWTLETITPVLKRADAAGLQCALHAVGDEAIKIAIDGLEQVGNVTGRHRIEHLELCTEEDSKRLGRLGITASIQPVHEDPWGLRAWPKLVGQDRCQRVFQYSEFADYGAVLAIGTDAPTAPLQALPNLYTATTGRSWQKPEYKETINPHFALKLSAAVTAATTGAAYSCFADDHTGKLVQGHYADLAVIDMKWDATKLLEAKVAETWCRGKRVFNAEDRD